MELFDLRGARLSPVLEQTLGPGDHSINLLSIGRIPVAGMLVAAVRVGEQVTRFRVSASGAAGGMERRVSPVATLAGPGRGVALDRLRIGRRGTTEAAIDVERYTGTLRIKLDLIPWEVLDIAVAEDGRYPDEVGVDLGSYPYDLARYLDKTGDSVHDYEAWCSEFVSWAYRAGGYPLSGGYQVPWMLAGSTTLRSWFPSNSAFVDSNHAEWETFVPRPGDYVRYDNSSGGHSGIVRRCSGDTLYTVEGNVGNRVRLRAIRNWRTYVSGSTRIDGIGKRSGYLSGAPIVTWVQ